MAIHYRHELDRVFHALGDGKRRAMLGLVARRGSCTAGELGEPFAISQPTTSKHLRVLESAGLVERRVEGRVHRFRLVPKRLTRAERWIVRHRSLWEGALERLEAYLEGEDE